LLKGDGTPFREKIAKWEPRLENHPYRPLSAYAGRRITTSNVTALNGNPKKMKRLEYFFVVDVLWDIKTSVKSFNQLYEVIGD
jgi:hypothetical protein